MAVKFQHVFAEALRHIKKASDAVTHLVNQPASEMAFLELPKRPNKIPIDHSLTLDQVQALLGIELPDPSLLWLFHMALTHKSASNDFNYERLEFIGDVIVKMAVSVYLYASFPLAEESGLSICGNFYKSNDWLGRAAIRMGLARVTVFSEGFRESIDLEPDPDDIHIGLSKVHGDLFESCCAAITMSVGLKKGIEWCREKIFGDRFPNRADNPDLNPKSVCFNRIAQLFKGAPVVFEIWSDSGAFFSYMAVGDYQFPFFEESRDRAKAMALVAEDVLKALDDPDFVKQVEEGLSAE
jgi:dsRNA-specific ribonuclease